MFIKKICEEFISYNMYNGSIMSSQELVMDILRVLATPDLEVRKKTLNLALDLVSSRNVEEVSVLVRFSPRIIVITQVSLSFFFTFLYIIQFPQMVLVLKKEVVKTNNSVEHEDTGKFRQLLVRTLHQCSVKFPDIAKSIIPVVSLCVVDGAGRISYIASSCGIHICNFICNFIYNIVSATKLYN